MRAAPLRPAHVLLLLLTPLATRSAHADSGTTPPISWSAAVACDRIYRAPGERCTLFINPDARARAGYSISWAGDGVLEAMGATSDLAPVSSEEATTDAFVRRATLRLSEGTNSTQMIPFHIRSGSNFTLAISPLSAPDTAAATELSRLPSLRIGDGGPRIRPEILDVTLAVDGDSASYLVTGIGLDQAAYAYAVTGLGRHAVPLPIVAQDPGSIRLGRLPVRSLATLHRLQLHTRAGSMTAIGLRAALRPIAPTRHIVCKLKADSLESILAASGMQGWQRALDSRLDELREIPGLLGIRPVSLAPRGWYRVVNDLGESTPAYEPADLAEVALANDTPPEIALAALRAAPLVEAAEFASAPPQLFQSSPNDPYWVSQWGLHETQGPLCNGAIFPNPGASIGAPLAWTRPPLQPWTLIGVLDNGITGTLFPDIVLSSGPPYNTPWQNSLAGVAGIDEYGSANCLDLWHGTAVASIATAVADNGYQIAGVSPAAVPVSYKFTTADAPIRNPWLDLVTSLQALLDDPVPVATLSFGGMEPGAEFVQLALAFRSVFQSGRFLCAASGNQYVDGVKFPASLDAFVFSVGAVLWNGLLWNDDNAVGNNDTTTGTSHGPELDVVAPGGRLIEALGGDYSPTPDSTTMYHTEGGGYCQCQPCGNCDLTRPLTHMAFGGTSAAAPVVAGVAAYLKTMRPTLQGEDIAETIRRTAVDLGAPGRDDLYGSGRVDFAAATAYVGPGREIEQGRLVSLAALADSVATTISLANYPGHTGTFSAIRYHLVGEASFSAHFLNAPDFWVRRGTTIGFGAGGSYDHLRMAYWGGVVGQWTASSADLETYVYRIQDGGQQYWIPCPPAEAKVAWTAIGSVGVGAPDATLSSGVEIRSYPNPTTGRARLRLAGLRGESALVEVFDLGGRRIARLHGGPVARDDEYVWDGRDLQGLACPAGVYLCRVETTAGAWMERIVLLR